MLAERLYDQASKWKSCESIVFSFNARRHLEANLLRHRLFIASPLQRQYSRRALRRQAESALLSPIHAFGPAVFAVTKPRLLSSSCIRHRLRMFMRRSPVSSISRLKHLLHL